VLAGRMILTASKHLALSLSWPSGHQARRTRLFSAGRIAQARRRGGRSYAQRPK
jgi:hypothetical protein